MKTIWVIDGAYLFNYGRGRPFDYLKLKNELVRLSGAPIYESYYLNATRDPAAEEIPELANLIEYGASVRGSLNLIKVAKAHAVVAGRTYISPHDVKTVAHDVLRHRVMVTYEAEAEGKTADNVIDVILNNVEVP